MSGSVVSATAGSNSGAGYILVTVSDGETQFTQRIGIAVTDGTTGIQTINHAPLTDNHYYNLHGQRLSQPQRGLNIIGGRKVYNY